MTFLNETYNLGIHTLEYLQNQKIIYFIIMINIKKTQTEREIFTKIFDR